MATYLRRSSTGVNPRIVFLIYINDIVTDIECHISLYADDTSLYIDNNITDKKEKVAALNINLNRLNTWQTTGSCYSTLRKPSTSPSMESTGYLQTPVFISITSDLRKSNPIATWVSYSPPNLDFSLHIDHLVNNCSKWIGLMWKLQRKYPRHCSENIYIRHTLDF